MNLNMMMKLNNNYNKRFNNWKKIKMNNNFKVKY